MADSFTETIEKFKAEIGNYVSELKNEPAWIQIDKLYRALTTIEELAGQPHTSLVELFGFEDAASGGKSVRVKQGEFYGLEALDAAKRYLRRKGEAATLDEIMTAAIETGRAKKIDKDTLRKSLSRSTWDVAKVDEDLYGLLEFFPHIKRGKKKAGSPEGEQPAVDETEDKSSA